MEAVTNIAGNRVRIASLVWCGAIAAAALAVAFLLPGVILDAWPVFAAAIAPGIIGLLLSPFARAEWAQVMIILSWIGLAIAACLALAFVPMAVLFLCVPAAAALFERERVIEALVLSAIGAGIVYYVKSSGGSVPLSLSEDVTSWGEVTAICATVVFMIASLFAISDTKASVSALSAAPKAKSASKSEVIDSDSVKMARRFLQTYPGAGFYIDEKGRVTGASARAKHHFGHERNPGGLELSGVLGLDAPETKIFYDAIKTLDKDGKSKRLILTIPADANRKNKTCFVQFDMSRDGEGSYVFLRDVTAEDSEADELRQVIAQSDADHARKSLFFAGVSHELRTPLNAIIGFSDMMRSRLFGPLPGKYSEYADLIHESGQHMLDLIGDVLDISKIEAGKYELTREEFHLDDVVRSAVKMVQPQADTAEVVIEAEFDDSEMDIFADRRAVRQILLNLLSNAVKFTPKGGLITVSAGQVGRNYEMTVSDNGLGMNAAELAQITMPYQQANSAKGSERRGTGLGLTLVKSLTDLHGGEFSVDSAPDEGTRATVLLPKGR